MADLTTLQSAKDWLGITSNTDDALLSALVTSASNYIQSWLDRTFAITAYNELRDGTGTRGIMTSEYPIASVSMVKIDGVVIPAATAYGTPGYRVDDRRITLQGGYCFRRDIANVELAYTAGYASVPAEISQACIDMISVRYKERDRIGYQSKSIAGETVSFMTKDMSDATKTILHNYRKVLPL